VQTKKSSITPGTTVYSRRTGETLRVEAVEIRRSPYPARIRLRDNLDRLVIAEPDDVSLVRKR